MFIGEFQHTIDEKGRIAIPAKFRSKISGGAVITRGLDRCLFIFANKDWEKFAQTLINAPSPIARANSRDFSRLFFSGASEVKLDSQGRVLIPDYLKKYAGLDKSAKIIGVYNRMEIWNERTWERHRERTEGSSDEIAEKMADLGI